MKEKYDLAELLRDAQRDEADQSTAPVLVSQGDIEFLLRNRQSGTPDRDRNQDRTLS